MRLHGRAMLVALAALGPPCVACVPDSPGGNDAALGDDSASNDGAGDDAATDDGPGDDSVAQDAPSDAASDAAPLDAAAGEASPRDSAPETSPSQDATAPSPDGAPGATLGTVVVTADASLTTTTLGGACAAANSLVAAPNETHVGGTIHLTASGIDPANQSSDVTLTWTANGTTGSLATTTGTSNTFTCASAGTEVVIVTASISEGGASCAANGSLTAQLGCSAP